MDADDFSLPVCADRPLRVIFGQETGMHIRALIGAEGEITWRPQLEFEFDSDTRESHPTTGYARIHEDWTLSPEEASSEYELRNGVQVLGRYKFAALTPPRSEAEEAVMNEDWKKVWAFAEAHGIRMDLHEHYCDQCLDIALGHQPHPPRRLIEPRASMTQQLSA